MNDLKRSSAQIQTIVIVQHPLCFTTKNPITIRVKRFRKATGFFHQLVLHLLQRQREPDGKPILFFLMYCNIIEVLMSANVVPVGMGGEHRDRQLCQAIHDTPNVRHAQPGVNQRGPLLPAQQVTMALLPMLIFTDGICLYVNLLNRKPAVHM